MKRATITEAKNGLSALLDEVRAGETILILDRGIPVATLEPVAKLEDPAGRIERLQRSGAIRAPMAGPPLHLLINPLAKTKADGSVVDALLGERRSGR